MIPILQDRERHRTSEDTEIRESGHYGKEGTIFEGGGLHHNLDAIVLAVSFSHP